MAGTLRQAKGTFTIRSWDEEPFGEVEAAPGLTRARVVTAYAGDLEGEGTGETLTCYRADSTATYGGYTRVVGSVGGRSGSFVLEGSGTYEYGAATTTWSVVPGSGTGELADLRGYGGFVAEQGEQEVAYRLHYSLG